MNKILLTLFLLIFPMVVFAAEKTFITPRDCGPLARGEYGAVFYTETNGSRQTYFIKGAAPDICPKLLTGKIIKGYEVDLCNSSSSFTSNECATIKEFKVISYD